DCTMHKCSFTIPVPAEGSTYCVSVKGTSYHPKIVGAPSEESCIHVPLKQTSSTQYIIILCGVIASLSVIFTVYCGCKKLKKKNIKLPKSLVSVIRSLNTESILEPKSDLKYVSVVHNIMPGQSVLPVNDEVTLLEAEPKEESVSLKNSSEGTSSAPPSEAPAKAEEVSVQESADQISFDDEQNRKESYFISDSSQMDICSNSSTPEVSATEVQQTVVPSSSLKFSGYDKPHVPLDMLIDVGEDQPVIAYRLTD
ncbi:INGR1 protein, partial [Trogon melanurus]|nr:INGR1 protein [Trogon melanurus]